MSLVKMRNIQQFSSLIHTFAWNSHNNLLFKYFYWFYIPVWQKNLFQPRVSLHNIFNFKCLLTRVDHSVYQHVNIILLNALKFQSHHNRQLLSVKVCMVVTGSDFYYYEDFNDDLIILVSWNPCILLFLYIAISYTPIYILCGWFSLCSLSIFCELTFLNFTNQEYKYDAVLTQGDYCINTPGL